MPTTVAISFPWGMYHGTPWGRNVNEGAVDWPPSPWRILRALYASWQERAPHLDPGPVRDLLSELSVLPEYSVPAFVQTHTRHYMPDMKYQPMVSQSTDKVLDAFVVTARDAQVGVSWPVTLDARLRAVLAELAAAVPYLGRADSICEARLLEEADQIEGSICRPVVGSAPAASLRLLAPEQPLDVAVLIARTADVRKQNRLDPPGARWVDYSTVDEFQGTSPARRRAPDKVTAVRWAIAGNDPRPSIHAAVAMAEALRRAVMSRYGSGNSGGVSDVLSGKDASGTPLRDHRHAHYLALDLDGDRLLDTLVLWAPAGLGSDELGALGQLDRLGGHSFIREFRPCRLGLEGFGEARDVIPEVAECPSTSWLSHTPFAPARHGRRRDPWEVHVADEVRRELAYRGFPAPDAVRVRRGGWLDFRRHRLSERLEDARRAIGVEIQFAEPVTGPIAIGALSHLGLGVLLPKR